MLRPLLVSESVRLTFEAPADLPPLYTDEGKVSQILRNFVSNALKYTERGEVRVTARIEPGTGAIAFAVSDTGIGIAPEDRDLIFQEFAQVEHRLQHRVKGTGLGLPLARNLAEILGGKLELESTVGVGSTFTAIIPTVYLPAADLARLGRAERDPTARAAPTSPPVALVIDDDDTARYVLKGMLATIRCVVVEAGCGADGLAQARQGHPDVIFLDLTLPDMAGDKLLAALKSEPRLARIPVIVVTGRVLSEAERAALLGGAVAILSKEHRSREEALGALRAAWQQALAAVDS